jgi:molecular chaperone DnaK
MARRTFDFGVDLGTTNSAIGVWDGDDVRIFRNAQRDEVTPSVVWINSGGGVNVGQTAKLQLESDPNNAFGEFKLQMGSQTPFEFQRSGRTMTATELSAQVLGQLRRTAENESGEAVTAAVVTVPANFELPAVNATIAAACLAGIVECETVPEPIAAALAYIRKGVKSDGYWLVYDLGGGTFDAALLETVGGTAIVVQHAGNPGLGGKLIDWDIVNQYMVPKLLRLGYQLPNFDRKEERWRSAFAKLKVAAEVAKIDLSSSPEPVCRTIEYLCEDASGRRVEFPFELTRTDVARLTEPYIATSIDVCRRLLISKALLPSDLKRLVLVGGPTLAPYVRDQLEAELRIPFDRQNMIDPLTVVARGAAAFAAGIERKKGDDTWPLGTARLTYQPAAGSSQRPEVTISIEAPSRDARSWRAGSDDQLDGATVQVVSQNLPVTWDSGQLQVPPSKTIVLKLFAPNVTNRFGVTLRGSDDVVIPMEPATLSYNRAEMTQSSLINSVGIEVESGKFERYFCQGKELPQEAEKVFETTRALPAGKAGAWPLDIVFYEGENDRAKRNRKIGQLRIESTQIRLALPKGSKVQVRIAIDRSRRVTTSAYCPALDMEWKEVLDLVNSTITPEELSAALQAIRSQREGFDADLARLRKDEPTSGLIDKAASALGEIDARRLEATLAQEVAAAAGDHDAADRADRHARELQSLLDDVEAALAWPKQVQLANLWADYAQRLISEYGYPEKQGELDTMRSEALRHIQAENKELLQQTITRSRELCESMTRNDIRILKKDLDYLATRIGAMKDPNAAQDLLALGQQAAARNDAETVRQIRLRLHDLLNQSEPGPPELRPVRDPGR